MNWCYRASTSTPWERIPNRFGDMCCWRGLWIGGLFTPSIFAPWIHVIRESPKVGGNKQANGCWQHSGNSLEAPVGELDWVGRIAELTRSKSNEPWNSFKSKQMKRMKNSTGDTQPKGRRRGVLAVPTGSMNYCKRRRKFKLAVDTFFFFFFLAGSQKIQYSTMYIWGLPWESSG